VEGTRHTVPPIQAGKQQIIEIIQEEFKIINTDIQIKINLSIAKQKVTLIVDSGSQLSLIKLKMVKPETVYEPKRKMKISGIAGKHRVETLGEVSPTIQMGGADIEHKFQLIDNNTSLDVDGILGMDFLAKYKAIINTLESILTIRRLTEKSPEEAKNYYEKRKQTIKKEQEKLNEEMLFLTKEMDKIMDNDRKITAFSARKEEPISAPTMDILLYKEYLETGEEKIKGPTIFDPIETKICLNIKTEENSRNEFLLTEIEKRNYNKEEMKYLKDLCKEYNDIFHLEGDKLSYTDVIQHQIELKPETKPIFIKQYRLPELQKEEVNKQLKEMENNGIIEQCNSQWNSPIILVKKKEDSEGNRKFRLVVDFRKLNDATVPQNFPIPLIDEIIDELKGAKFFTTLDLHAAFHQILLHPEDRDFTAFSAGFFKYRWVRMPMGLTSAPHTWQKAINTIFRDMLGPNIHIYLDDLLISSDTMEKHKELLKNVFERLRQHNLQLKIEKTAFFRDEVEYLGHMISRNGIKPNNKKVECIKLYPKPTNVTEIQRFLGMCNYYRRYIPDYAKIAKPLYILCKKDQPFIWNEACEIGFNKLKRLLMSTKVLIFPNFQETFIVTTDASDVALGAVLSQGEIPFDRPIQYFSKVLNKAQRNYSTIEKELLSIITAVEAFRHYLYGREFIVITDHKPLCYMLRHKNPSSRLHRWKLTLMEYKFKIIHRSGAQNFVADALSRIKLDPNTPLSLENIIELDENIKITLVTTRASTRKQLKDTPTLKLKDAYNITENNNVMIESTEYDQIFFLLPQNKSNLQEKIEEKIKQPVIISKFNEWTQISETKTIAILKTPNDSDIYKELISEILKQATINNWTNIAINIDFHNHKNYLEFKILYREIFKNSTTSTTFFLNKVMEVVEIEDIDEILRIYHHSLLGGHVGNERMKNNIRKYYHWPSMTNDIKTYIKNCTTCEKTKTTKHTKSPLQITSTGEKLFDHTFVDFVGPITPPSSEGHNYLFTATCDLTKYAVAVPTYDCTAITTAKALMENVILKFNLPSTLTSDRGTNFNAETVKEVTKLLDINKITTSAWHPQSNMVERYHRTLNEYLRAFTEKQPNSWHEVISFALFSYNNCNNTSTGFSPHELTYGFTIKLPAKVTDKSTKVYNYDNYSNELKIRLQETQELAKEKILKRKIQNKNQHDKKLNKLEVKINDLVLVRIPVKNGKYGHIYEGPYRVEKVISETNVVIRKGKKSEHIHNDRLIKAKANYGEETPPEI
jgi:hypothetical protein